MIAHDSIILCVLWVYICCSRGISILAYLNLLTAGYEFSMYVHFILRSVEFYVFIVGILMIIGALVFPTKRKAKQKK
ncbi:hypothetical protein BkAM31D_17450 [Halalkalibacter krulwichiae]|uniref:Uncharacterized protein n=1 Tax=Halalkalibacter krulwichiae TaxID=199441 RepID=A0A1X9MDG0_9BACI|nr:hypothetical protein BkAM31D_17450 [Halalkalibacter krulwichiae]